jgi:hypothetical protein
VTTDAKSVALFGRPVIITTEEGHLDRRTVDVGVVCCPDFRLKDYVPELIHRWLGFRDYDDPKSAGGVMRLAHDFSYLREFMKDCKLFREGHGINHLILLSHDDCAWCKMKGLALADPKLNLESCAKSMNRLKEELLKTYPDLEIHCGHLHFLPKVNQIQLIPVL